MAGGDADMISNLKLYCSMIEVVEKKKKEALRSIRKNKLLENEQNKELLQKYDALLLEKYKKLEEMLEKEENFK